MQVGGGRAGREACWRTGLAGHAGPCTRLTAGRAPRMASPLVARCGGRRAGRLPGSHSLRPPRPWSPPRRPRPRSPLRTSQCSPSQRRRCSGLRTGSEDRWSPGVGSVRRPPVCSPWPSGCPQHGFSPVHVRNRPPHGPARGRRRHFRVTAVCLAAWNLSGSPAAARSWHSGAGPAPRRRPTWSLPPPLSRRPRVRHPPRLVPALPEAGARPAAHLGLVGWIGTAAYVRGGREALADVPARPPPVRQGRSAGRSGSSPRASRWSRSGSSSRGVR